ncbi:MAG: NUDIX hydrolase [Erythrobacter sp.]|nr:NUDIX hydrolase [Erythrobacter sp.]
MSAEDAQQPEEIAWQGKWITAKRRGRWEYVSRARDISAAVILPIDGDEVVLVEQYRLPIDRVCLELPAGLIGDEDGAEDEDHLDSARRELIEETGYAASEWRVLGEFVSSPGMTSETFTLLLARGLTKVGEGGGLPGEDITVRRVRLADMATVVAQARAEGKAIDNKLIALLAPTWLDGLL